MSMSTCTDTRKLLKRGGGAGGAGEMPCWVREERSTAVDVWVDFDMESTIQ